MDFTILLFVTYPVPNVCRQLLRNMVAEEKNRKAVRFWDRFLELTWHDADTALFTLIRSC